LTAAAAKQGKTHAPESLERLAERFDHEAFDPAGERAVIRLATTAGPAFDVTVSRGRASLGAAKGQPDAILTADDATWEAIADDVASGMRAFRRGRLRIRKNLHLGIGFLAATAAERGPGRLRFRRLRTRSGSYSALEAGVGKPVLMLHGLGGTKASFLPTVAALAPSFRTIAVDLLGFGDSDKPLGASYSPEFQARTLIDLLDALELERSHFIGHSMGGRIALELGFRSPERTIGLVLMTPAVAWLGERRWAPYLRLIRPELGLIQIAPRGVVETVMRRLVPGAESTWGASAIDEFVRTYTTARGRAALYAAARNIYLDEPHGENGFWTQLRTLAPESLFIWGRQDRLVPTGFMKHVEQALPAARHVELDCGHLPQIECPREAHAAIARFLEKVKPIR
jgi:pimeloyl-ACP methyl ester carboxylesterase/putative sterol carrier protein